MNQEAYTSIEKTVACFIKVNPYLLKYYTREDLSQEIYTHFLEKDFFSKYNPNITSFAYFVARASKNHLIDLCRKRIIQTSSLNIKIGDQEGSEIGDLVEDPAANDSETYLLLEDLLKKISDNNISPSYNLTWKNLLKYVIKGFSPKEISKRVVVTTKSGTRNLSSSRISQLIGELRSECFQLI